MSDKDKQDRQNAIAKAQRVAAREKAVREALGEIAFAQQFLTTGAAEIIKMHATDREDRATAEKEEKPWRDEVAARFGYAATDLRVCATRLVAAMHALEVLPPELP
jgi:hypothetical protein